MGLPKEITAAHVEQAIGYIRRHGNSQGKHSIFSAGRDRGRGVYLAVLKEGRGFGIKDVLRVAHCFSKRQSPNKNGRFTDDQLKLLDETIRSKRSKRSDFISHDARDHLINLKFKVQDYENVLLFKINQSYKTGITEKELYEATRGVWKIKINRACTIKYAVAIVDDVIREVYEIDSWHIAGTIKYKTRPYLNKKDPKRKEFIGKRAKGDIRKLIGRKVSCWEENSACYRSLKELMKK